MAMCSTKTAVACRTRWSNYGRPMPAAAISTSSTSIPRRSIRISPAPAARMTDANGYYKFVTIKPGAYPWGNHHNAWRPAHIHFSVFGHSFVSRLVTQMYFPGDPLFPFDPIFNSVPDANARERMISSFDLENTQPEWALCYRFNIVLRGRNATPMETK